MAGEPIEGRHVVLMAFDTGDGVPGPLPCAICGLCAAMVNLAHDGEPRHLQHHAVTDTLRDGPTSTS